VTFLSRFDENVTVAACIESAIRISNMLSRALAASPSQSRSTSFRITHRESISCGLRRMVYLLVARGAHDLETSAVLETGADVQIGGGVRVGDAFQAIVGP
jgi:hypothetical protein